MMENQTGFSEITLLRRFEPVVRYTRGERFFPLDVDRYIQECSLWVQRPDQPAELLVPEGELTVEKLAEFRQDGFGCIYYLKFIEPLDLLDLARYSYNQAVKTFTHHDDQDIFRAGRGRLARVGYGSRFVDALFSITLLTRGRVPGDTAAAAALTYQSLQTDQERYCYYGRVVRENGWVILQYWYFYPFNNWRSGFFGVNDHEGDWEMVCVYCSGAEAGGGLPCSTGSSSETGQPERSLSPQWVAYASHDFAGDDLRRRWDDPELEKVSDSRGGCHPVIYAGAGSHASYFSPGEYLTELELPFLSPLVRLVDKIQDFWVGVLRQNGAKAGKPEFNVFRVPFVDYARGDGLSIGPGQSREWDVCILDANTPWAMKYRGLWGLYARDPIAGENAPAGPVFNRDGSVRRSWYDPLGWAGLDKVTPTEDALRVLNRQQAQAEERCAALKRTIAEKSAKLTGLGVELSAIQGISHLENVFAEQSREAANLSSELGNLRQKLTIEQAKLEAFHLHRQSLSRGDKGPLRAHIHRAHSPTPPGDLILRSLAEGFAAVSIGLVMIGIVMLILFARQYLIFGLALMVGLLIFVEAGFRRQLSQLINSLSLGLAVVSIFILLFQFFWEVVVLGVLVAGIYIMYENIREIRS